jgi:FkbM family methyltransferase
MNFEKSRFIRRSFVWIQWRFLQVLARIPGVNSLPIPMFYPFVLFYHLGVPPSWVYKEIFLNECYAAWSRDDVTVIVDLGANVGLAALYYMNRYPKARVISIEPNPDAVSCLRKNLGSYSNSEVISVAVAKNAGRTKLWVDTESASKLNSSITGRDRFGRHGKFNSVFITTKRLEEIIPSHVDLLKVDIEGAEYEVLASLCVNPSRIRTIVSEFHDLPSRRSEFFALISTLTSRGYKCLDSLPHDPLPSCAILRFQIAT